MKVQTINGETLRKEFTAIEAAALKHAAEYCVEGDQFRGVPTSNEERYRLSKETFGVIEHDGTTVSIIRHSTGKTLRAMINGGNGGGTKPQPRPESAPDELPDELPEIPEESDDEPQPDKESENAPESEPQPEEVQPEEVQPEEVEPEPESEPDSMNPFNMLVQQVVEAVMKRIKPILEKLVRSQTPNKVEHVHTIKINNTANQVDGIKHPKYLDVVTYVANRENVYLYGPAGSGKNVLCEQVAKQLGVPFYYQNTLLTKFDVTGYKNAAGEFEETEFYKAWTQGGLFMLDEADNTTAEAMVTLNAALANGYYAFPGVGRVNANPKFYCMAAGNTNGQGATDEYCGRYKMDESSRDRFGFVEIEYAPEVEKAIAEGHQDVLDFVYELRSICKEQNISLICGYRAIAKLVKFYDYNAESIISDFILKGAEKDTVREIARRLNGDNKYCEAFRKLAEL